VRVEQVPQDQSILDGHQRACYAQDASGRYVVATSRGWQVEAIANAQAHSEIEANIARVLAELRAGRASPLAWHMARFHMQPALLAAHAGFWTWRVRRHLRAGVFRRLPERVLQRYADVFGIDVETLRRGPGG
jgi:hypothetical protein